MYVGELRIPVCSQGGKSNIFVDTSKRQKTMDAQTIKERVAEIEVKRESLVRLLDRSDLGALRIDVSQAIEEIDDLLEEFKRTFNS